MAKIAHYDTQYILYAFSSSMQSLAAPALFSTEQVSSNIIVAIAWSKTITESAVVSKVHYWDSTTNDTNRFQFINSQLIYNATIQWNFH